ncbi:MAG TPA: hypothetical protein ENI74_06025, partial [Gammaproteobacteria bacterium]|nr:hypothetical protein [Gammaproteobacteria bacterium]
MKIKIYRLLVLLVLLPWLGACSMGQIVARTSVSIMDGNVEAMEQETDLVLAEAAIPANLKLIEGLIVEDPHNPDLLYLAAQGFYGYAFGFVELSDPQRAEKLYARGYVYGVRGLHALGLDKDFDLATASPDAIEKAVAKMGAVAVPALFWTASCWAKQIDLRRTDPARIAQLASTERLMARIREIQPDYYYGGVYLYYGVYYGSRAPMMGGDFARSEENFLAANAVSDNRLLIVDVLQAEYLERQRLDRDRFHRLLRRVVTDPVG